MRATKLKAFFMLLACLVLTHCGTPAGEQMTDSVLPNAPSGETCPLKSRNPFFAAPMCTTYVLKTGQAPMTAADADGDPTLRAAFTSAALIDSRTKCQAFVSKFTGEQAGSNLLLDTGAIVLSGVAAAITGPASTIRGLAAGSTALQGFKQTNNADLFQQMSIALFVQEINTNYFQVLDSEFPPENIASISAPAALARIEAVHRNCSIPFAAANMAASNQPKPAQATKASYFTLGGIPTAGDAVMLTATSASTGFPVKVTITIAKSDRPLNWASELMFQIQTNPVLSQSGVIAGVASQTASSVKLSLQGGPADISWAASVTTASGGTPTETVTPSTN